MSTIRIRKTIDSDTITLPELRPFIGHTVEIVIAGTEAEPANAEFWACVSQLPATEAEFAARQELLHRWRGDRRYEAHWPTIDQLLSRNFEEERAWNEVLAATWNLKDYDYAAIDEANAADIRNQEKRFP